MIVTTTNFYRLDKHRKWPDSISWGGASTNELILILDLGGGGGGGH